MSDVGRLFVEALRFDRDNRQALEKRAGRALELGAGGFILFGGEAEAVAALVAWIRAEAGRDLWFAADLERGPGQQFSGAPTLPPPAALAAHPDAEEATRRAGALTGRVARELGINWVLAPVLDLDVEPDNPIVATRSFGPDPDRVGRLGGIWIDACQAEGAAACAKHFPGHGRSITDSHIGLPLIDASREALRVELAPFEAVAGRVESVMTAHVAYPSLGGEGPATLEPAILRTLLRTEIGFEGLVVTDALIMGGFDAAADADGPETGLVARAVRAGCDLLLYPPDLAAAQRALDAAASADDELRRHIRDAAARSQAACSRYARNEPRAGPWGAEAEGRHDVNAVVALATGCVRGDPEAVRRALDPTRAVTISLVSDDRRPPGLPPLGATFGEELEQLGWTTRHATDGATRHAPGQVIVLLEATPQGWKGRADLSRAALESVQAELAAARSAGAGVYLVALGHARLLDSLPGPAACAWAAEPVMERAAARWIDAAVR